MNMEMERVLPLFVAVPLGMAFFIPMVSRWVKWVPDVLGNLTLLFLMILSLLMIGKTSVIHLGNWRMPLGIDLRLDGLSVLLLIAVNVIGFSCTLFSVSYMRRYTSKLRYYSLFLFMISGVNGVCLTGDIFNLYIFMEIAFIASCALVGFGCEHEEMEAAFKYLVQGSIASVLILIGIAMVYGITGTLNMAHMAAKIAMGHVGAPLYFALALFISGFSLKAALVPFHAWLPDAHPAAPAPVSAMLSGVVIKTLGLYVLARLLFNVFGVNGEILSILRWLGTLSMVIGVLLAVGQWDMKRLFACHSISQIGYVALGLGLGTPLGVIGGLYHLVNHSVFKSLLFLNAGSVEYSTGTRNLKELGGLNKAMPVTAATSMIASLSIAGIPPFNGFWSKLLIIVACVMSGHPWFAAWAVFVSLMTLASFMKVQKYGFYEKLKISLDGIKTTPAFMALPMIFLSLLCAGMALLMITGFKTPALITPAADVLIKGIFIF